MKDKIIKTLLVLFFVCACSDHWILWAISLISFLSAFKLDKNKKYFI